MTANENEYNFNDPLQEIIEDYFPEECCGEEAREFRRVISNLFEQTARGCVPDRAMEEWIDIATVEHVRGFNACRQQTLTAITQAGEKMRGEIG